MKTKLCIDCGATFQPTHGRQNYCTACREVRNRDCYSRGWTGLGRHAPGRTATLTDKANAGIDLARRNMWRRALGLEVLGGDDNA